MLDNLINLIKERAGTAIINNPAIPNEQNDEAIATTGNSITNSLQNMLGSGGGLKELLAMFGGQGAGDMNNPVVQNVSGKVTQDLMRRFNLDEGSAGNIAGGLVPDVLRNLVQRTNDPNDNSFDIQSIFNNLSGGKTSGLNIQNLLSKVTSGGLDRDGDGDTDLQDIMAMFKGGGNRGGNNLMDNVSNLFGR
jgi:hypothetical protein